MAAKTAPEIAAKLSTADRKGLLSRPGSANFSSAVLARLDKAGLIDRATYHPTDLGYDVREILSPGIDSR